MEAQRKQMNARSLLNNAFYFILFYFILLYIYIYNKMPYKKKAIPGTVQFNTLIAELPEEQEG